MLNPSDRRWAYAVYTTVPLNQTAGAELDLVRALLTEQWGNLKPSVHSVIMETFLWEPSF